MQLIFKLQKRDNKIDHYFYIYIYLIRYLLIEVIIYRTSSLILWYSCYFGLRLWLYWVHGYMWNLFMYCYSCDQVLLQESVLARVQQQSDAKLLLYSDTHDYYIENKGKYYCCIDDDYIFLDNTFMFEIINLIFGFYCKCLISLIKQQ